MIDRTFRMTDYSKTRDPELAKKYDVVPLLDRDNKCRRYGYWWVGVPPIRDHVAGRYPLTEAEAFANIKG